MNTELQSNTCPVCQRQVESFERITYKAGLIAGFTIGFIVGIVVICIAVRTYYP